MEIASTPLEETWSLEDLFPDAAAFDRAREELERHLPSLERWRGRLSESAATLAAALEEITEACKRIALLRCYASLRSDLNTRVAPHEAARQSVELLITALSRRTAYLRPEILATEPTTVESFLDAEPRLAVHAFFLRDLMRQRAHVLSPPEEKILAESDLLTRSASSLYHVLHNVDLPRPEITLSDGERVRLTPVAFQRLRASTNRADRLALFPAYYAAYADFDDTLGQNLYAAIKAHIFQSRVRGYASCLAAALDADNVPTLVYRNLIQRVREQLPLLHRYLALRGRALGLERLEYPDLYCPLAGSPTRRYTPEEARRVVGEAAAPLGRGYVEALTRAFHARWIDWHPADGKCPGAYATGWAYDVHPFVLLNFTGELESVSTLAHEMGHAMHSYFSNRAQPFATAECSIFVAEVASTLNEALLSGRLLERATTPEEQRFLLASYLDGIRGTLFRQALFAEFELEIHERSERGEVLTGELLNEIYLGLLRDYHGHDAGVMRVDERYAVEWAAVPHFYYGFYVYQYATGIVAATALAETLRQQRAGGSRRYLEFLAAGGSDYPLELLRRAGVDLESAAPYAAAFAAVERSLDRLESLLDPGS